jgi:phosphoribosyl 1,2-cyclic phosphodiesterase
MLKSMMRMTVLASGSKGNSTVISSSRTRVLVDAGLSCRELLRRMAAANEDPATLDAILITHEHLDHVAGLAVLARRLRVPVFFTEPTHRAWVRMLTPRTTMSYTKWMEKMAQEKAARTALATAGDEGASSAGAGDAEDSAELPVDVEQEAEVDAGGDLGAAGDLDATVELEAAAELNAVAAKAAGAKADPAFLPAVEYFEAGKNFSIGDIAIQPFTVPHDAADPCGFVFQAEGVRMALATDLGYMPANVKEALRGIDVLLLESNHDLEMLRDGPYPWSVKQRVLSRVGHLSNDATAEFLARDYDGGAAYIVLGHLSESNNAPELARLSAERAIGDRMTLLGNRIVLAEQAVPLAPITL